MEKSAAQDMKSLLVTNGMTSRAAGRNRLIQHGAWLVALGGAVKAPSAACGRHLPRCGGGGLTGR